MGLPHVPRESNKNQKVMENAKIKLGLQLMTITEKIAFINSVISAINKSAYYAGVISTAGLEAKRDALIVALTARDSLKAESKAGTEDVHQKDDVFDDEILNVALEAEQIANGDALILESGGFKTYLPGRAAPIGVLAQVMSLEAIPGISAGTIILNWNPVYGAKGYQVYISTSATGNFRREAMASASEFLLTGLNTGTVYYIKVSALGAEGEAPLSDIASCVAR
jgi:fibronectin type III domain protein